MRPIISNISNAATNKSSGIEAEKEKNKTALSSTSLRFSREALLLVLCQKLWPLQDTCVLKFRCTLTLWNEISDVMSTGHRLQKYSDTSANE